MPEYILPTENAGPAWRALDSFTQGFVEAAFFSNTSCYAASEFFSPEAQDRIREGQADGSIPSDAGPEDIEPESLQAIAGLCSAFQREHAALLTEAYARDYDEALAGCDFYYTRAGHGVGYWDCDQLDAGALGDRLSAAAGRHEISLDAYESGDAPNGFYVSFYL